MSRIPHEVIHDILLQLPVKSLVRFRSLSKPICSLIDGQDFINLHLNHSITAKSNHSIILKEWDLFAVDFDALSDAVEVKQHPLYSGGGTEVIAGYVYYGFGYDSYGDDYKVVRMAHFVREDGGGDGGGLGCERGYGVFAGHALHWIVPQRRQLGIRDCVLGFDIRDDKFFELPQPDYENKGMNFQVDVGVLEGNLCVMCNYEHVCVEVWVMKEYGVKESWCKMFSVHAIKWIGAFMFLRPLVYSKGGDMVLLEVNGEKLLWYDWKTKHAKVVRVRGGPRSFGSEMYVESLIRINDGDRIGWKKQQELDEEEEEEEEKRKTNRNKR
uniref:F-box domain-containing protein n=1 Tax=Populus alba TaxID=43335 RepID=A0A4U5MBC3_POPAL|nr:hypothetical protein D5086_0000318970 [Populus alba]